jgi:hypothetical protein
MSPSREKLVSTFAFKRNLCRCSSDQHPVTLFYMNAGDQDSAVGLCTLNQVDTCPITYSLSNP